MTKNFFIVVLISFVVFFFSWFFVHLTGINALNIQSEDTLPAIFLPLSIIKSGNIYLDPFYSQLIKSYPNPDDKNYFKGFTPFYLIKVNGHYLSAFPIMTALLIVPVYLMPVLAGVNTNWNFLILISHIASALIVAFSGGFLYLLLKKNFDLSNKKIYLLLCIYYFASVNYAMISQALWQHGTLQFFMILSIYYLLESLKSELRWNRFLLGLFLGLSILSRPTALLPAALLIMYFVWLKKQSMKESLKRLFPVVVGLGLCALFFVYYNSKYYVNITNQGYSSQITKNWLSPFPQSFLGVWFSPSKGILIFSPIFIFSIFGFIISIKNKNLLFIIFGLIIILHTLVISFWNQWYGGWSFGYRMSSDIIPFLILLLVPFVNSDYFKHFSKLFYLTLVLSIAIQIYGIIFFDGIWHAAYDRGLGNTSWLWSIKDSEFVFDARRVLVKFGILKKACSVCL